MEAVGVLSTRARPAPNKNAVEWTPVKRSCLHSCALAPVPLTASVRRHPKSHVFDKMKSFLTPESNTSSHGACRSFGRAICAGAVLLIASSTQAQDLFASDYDNGNIYAFTPDGTQRTFASGLVHPTALAFNGAGDLFVAANDPGTIYKFTPDGVRSTFASGLSDPQGLAFDNAGNLYEADWISGTIYRFTPAGVKSSFASGLVAPTGLAFNSAGDLFVAEQNGGMPGGNEITKITLGGVKSVFADTLGYGLAFDSAGNLFEAEWVSGNINEFTPDGVRSTFASGLRFPWGLAFNSADELFVSDMARWQIYKFSPDGTESTFASGSGYGFDGLAFQIVPEPSVLGLMGVGVIGLLIRRKQSGFTT
jgi:sugar lactone lactonase YvrE